MKEQYSLADFCEIMRTLRAENGCPWDRVQTHESLRQCLLEEAYEAADAIDQEDMPNLCEELGDLLMQIVFHALIEEEKGGFTLQDVLNGISRKMIQRHPHVFGGERVDTSEEVLDRWEELKKEEKQISSYTEALRRVPKAMPALQRAEKVQKKAAQAGMEFSDVKEVLDKLKEEMDELTKAIDENGNIEEELGDLLFSMVNLSRFLQRNAELVLTKSIEKFINRFECVEKGAGFLAKDMPEIPAEQLSQLWEEAKVQY